MAFAPIDQKLNDRIRACLAFSKSRDPLCAVSEGEVTSIRESFQAKGFKVCGGKSMDLRKDLDKFIAHCVEFFRVLRGRKVGAPRRPFHHETDGLRAVTVDLRNENAVLFEGTKTLVLIQDRIFLPLLDSTAAKAHGQNFTIRTLHL